MLPLRTLPVLDVTVLSKEQLKAAGKLFAEIAGRDLLPLHQLDKDDVRCELDERFGREVLDLPAALFAKNGPVDILRRKLAAEPSVRGNKPVD